MVERRKTGRLFLWTVGGLCAIFLLVGLFFALLQTDTAREKLAALLTKQLSSDPALKLTFQKPSGLIPFQVRFDEITASDAGGVWLRVRGAVLWWSPWGLLRGRLDVHRIGASGVRIERLPPGPPKDESAKSEPFSFPRAFPPITVEQLSIADLYLGEAVLGESGLFTVEGSIAPAARGRGLTASLHVARKDGPETRADVQISTFGSPAQLDAKIDFHEAPEGWVAAVLGDRQGGGMDVTLEGSGPVTDWKGTLSGTAHGYGELRSEIAVSTDQTTNIQVQGKYQPVGVSAPSDEWREWLKAEARFHVQAKMSEQRFVALEKAEFEGNGIRLQASGKIDLESLVLETAWGIEAAKLEPFTPVLGVPVAGKLTASGSLSGEPGNLHGTLSARFSELRVGELRAEGAEIHLDLAPPAHRTPPLRGFKVTGNGDVTGMIGPGSHKLPEDSFQWSLDLEAPSKGPVTITTLKIEGKEHSLTLSGEVRPEELAGNLDATLKINDTRPLTGLLGRELPAEAEVQMHLSGNGRSRSASAQIEGHIAAMKNAPDSSRLLLAPQVMLTGRMDLTEGKQVTVSDVRVESDALLLGATAELDLVDRSLKAGWQFKLPNLALLKPVLQRNVSGAVEGKGEVAGPLNAWNITASLTGIDVVWDNAKLQRVAADLTAAEMPEKPHGSIKLDLKQEDQKLVASTDFSLQEHRLKLPSLLMQTSGSSVTGDVVVDLEKTLATGTVSGDVSDLSVLGRFFGETMEGKGGFDAKLSEGKSGQNVKLSANAAALRTPFGSARSIKLSADLSNVWESPRGEAVLELAEMERSGLVLHSLTFKGSGREGAGDFQMATRGHARQDFDLQTRGTLSLSKDATQLKVDTFSGHYAKYPLKLLRPAALKRSGSDFNLEKLVLSLGGARLEASASLTSKRVRLDSGFENLPLEMASLLGGPDLKGLAEGSIRLDGDASAPSGLMKLKLTGVRATESTLKELPAATVDVEAKLQGGQLTSKATIGGVVKSPANVDFAMPLEFSILPFSYAVSPQGSVQGHLAATAELANLAALFPQENHLVSGSVGADVTVRGVLAHPELGGAVTLSGGSYQNLVYGTVLKEASTQIVLKGNRVEIRGLTATDGEKGKLRADGWLEVDDAGRLPISLEAHLSDARLIRRDDATGLMGGNLKISGALNDMALDGQLMVASADVTLAKQMVHPMTDLEVIEINLPESRKELQKKARTAEAPLKIRLDIAVSSPGHVIVRGPNLNSEWKGDLRISGSTQDPTIVGVLTLVRGQYNFLDRPFKLVEGFIQFYGASPPQPRLSITAEATTKDLTARLLLTGTVSDPKLELQSDPPLPSDEILARLLFGRNLSSITPFQAAKLALALKSLSGKGDAWDLMERTRKVLGVDQLELRDAKEGTALGIGKYLTEDVYVDVEKGLGNEPGKVTVQVEMTPHITLESEAGTDQRKGIGLNWKYDY